MSSVPDNIPNAFYWAIGIIVFMNIGTIFSVLFALFRGVWWLSKLESRVVEAKAMAIRAHKRIDLLNNDGGTDV